AWGSGLPRNRFPTDHSETPSRSRETCPTFRANVAEHRNCLTLRPRDTRPGHRRRRCNPEPRDEPRRRISYSPEPPRGQPTVAGAACLALREMSRDHVCGARVRLWPMAVATLTGRWVCLLGSTGRVHA